jgi:hypothetical protein
MSQKANSLNPSASEFVPNFSVPDMSNLNINDNQIPTAEEQTYQPPANNQRYQTQNNYHQHQGGYYQNQHHHNSHQQQQHSQPQPQQQPQQFYGQNNNNSHRHSYNPNYRGRNRNYNHHHQNNHYGSNNGYHGGYNNHQQHQQTYDVDPFELEARCGAVIEILQDDKIRDQLNPQSNYADTGEDFNQAELNNQNADPQLDDEEEMAEMMAMQEECRLEMMKFYIQSQNPTLFEEIYHDVSYPEAAGSKKVPEEELRNPKVMPSNVQFSTAPVGGQTEIQNNTLRDLIINELNPDVAEFVPNKFSSEPENVSTQETA